MTYLILFTLYLNAFFIYTGSFGIISIINLQLNRNIQAIPFKYVLYGS
jgi:hypothetical protein